MIIVWGSVVAAEDQMEELLALSLEHVQRSRQEEGCIAHGAHVDAENGCRVVFFEKWEDEAALRRHFAVPASQEFVKRASALAREAPTIDVFRAEPISL